ncbi:MAG: rod shape-determining protein MreC [Alphaproteobacteria bacterium 41-28]|nr:MAG: rod shape-determining protein MreC [Alphaproteobacteria bacterium 41-28]
MALFVRHIKPGPLKPTANPYPSRFHRWRHSLGVTFVLILIVGGTLRFYKPFYDVIQQGAFESTALIHGIFIHPFHQAHTLLKDTHTFMYLKEEYARLKDENEALKWQLQALTPLQHENALLRENLKVPTFEKHGHLTAPILSSPYDGLHHFFLIAAGQREGLEKDQAVIVPKGVVGRLEKVGRYVSRVLLLNDTNSRIPVMTSASEQKAILAGDGSFFPTLVYVGDVRKVQRGENVVTSGLGGIFPPGLPVGRVEGITNGKIRVRPYVPFQDLEWVHILRTNPHGFLEERNMVLEGE